MHDAHQIDIYSKSDPAILKEEIPHLKHMITYECHKKLLFRISENIELLIAKSFLEPESIDLLFDKIVKTCVHYDIISNLDQLMVRRELGYI